MMRWRLRYRRRSRELRAELELVNGNSVNSAFTSPPAPLLGERGPTIRQLNFKPHCEIVISAHIEKLGSKRRPT